MIVDGDWKLIRTWKSFRYAETFVRKAGAAELYDLGSDPGEEENLAELRPDVLAELAGRLDAWLAERRQSRDGAGVQPETSTAMPRSRERLEGLRALGYIE